MEVVAAAADAERALETARRQGEAYFADAAVYVEKYVEDPRHVEIQVLADRHGQHDPPRRARLHAPAPPPEGARGVALARPCRPRCASAWERWPSPLRTSVGYVGAGTVECLLDRHGAFFFLEMNTRIQVEHPVTELVTGFDLVRAQIEIAGGAELPIAQADVELPRPRVRMPHQRRGRRRRTSGPPRGASSATTSRPARASASTRASRRATRWSASTTR